MGDSRRFARLLAQQPQQPVEPPSIIDTIVHNISQALLGIPDCAPAEIEHTPYDHPSRHSDHHTKLPAGSYGKIIETPAAHVHPDSTRVTLSVGLWMRLSSIQARYTMLGNAITYERFNIAQIRLGRHGCTRSMGVVQGTPTVAAAPHRETMQARLALSPPSDGIHGNTATWWQTGPSPWELVALTGGVP
ncbi:hypothetical protein PG997_002143 [Apiospora hydei]|uniref:Uncharacterized protein n=1 Tax=Apiospora hydei TaxID=1337664 RepID=A0ABR1X8K4_9PEZI